MDTPESCNFEFTWCRINQLMLGLTQILCELLLKIINNAGVHVDEPNLPKLQIVYKCGYIENERSK